MIENVRMAIKGIWSHRLRSVLSITGIIIGIAAMTAIAAVISGTNEKIKESVIGSGKNLVHVELNRGNGDTYDEKYDPALAFRASGVPVYNSTVVLRLEKEKTIQSVSFYRNTIAAGAVSYENREENSCEIYGIDKKYLEISDYQVTEGRGFTDNDFKGRVPNVLINGNARLALFGEKDAIGKLIQVDGNVFRVVGVVEEKNPIQLVVTSYEDHLFYKGSNTPQLFMTLEVWESSYYMNIPQNVLVKAVDTDHMTAAGQSAEAILNASIMTSFYHYKTENTYEQAVELQELSGQTAIQIWWVAAITLVLGGIGVMNIMLVSVKERTAEIGLKKAIGAKRYRILAQFLTEAVVLTAIGGILGVIGGIGISYLLSLLNNIPWIISMRLIIISVIFSVLIGIVFGLFPSIKAANLDPIDALKVN